MFQDREVLLHHIAGEVLLHHITILKLRSCICINIDGIEKKN